MMKKHQPKLIFCDVQRFARSLRLLVVGLQVLALSTYSQPGFSSPLDQSSNSLSHSSPPASSEIFVQTAPVETPQGQGQVIVNTVEVNDPEKLLQTHEELISEMGRAQNADHFVSRV